MDKDQPQKYRRGHTNPTTGKVFWGYHPGNNAEIWVEPERYASNIANQAKSARANYATRLKTKMVNRKSTRLIEPAIRRQLAAGKSPHYMAVYHNLPLSVIQNIINDLNQE